MRREPGRWLMAGGLWQNALRDAGASAARRVVLLSAIAGPLYAGDLEAEPDVFAACNRSESQGCWTAARVERVGGSR